MSNPEAKGEKPKPDPWAMDTKVKEESVEPKVQAGARALESIRTIVPILRSAWHLRSRNSIGR